MTRAVRGPRPASLAPSLVPNDYVPAGGGGVSVGGSAAAGRLFAERMEVEAVRRDDELLSAVCHSPVAIH